jgi:hypothetical protein
LEKKEVGQKEKEVGQQIQLLVLLLLMLLL